MTFVSYFWVNIVFRGSHVSEDLKRLGHSERVRELCKCRDTLATIYPCSRSHSTYHWCEPRASPIHQTKWALLPWWLWWSHPLLSQPPGPMNRPRPLLEPCLQTSLHFLWCGSISSPSLGGNKRDTGVMIVWLFKFHPAQEYQGKDEPL